MRLKVVPMCLVAAVGVVLSGSAALAQSADDQEVWVGNESLIPVADGQARKVAPLREPAYLYVEAESPDAEILLQNNLEFRGRAFLKIRDTRLVRVTVKSGGKGAVDGFVELSEREVLKFKVGYQRPAGVKTGTVTLLSSPNGAEVYLDGAPVGQTPLTLRKVPVGSRQLAMTYGSWNWQGLVSVRPERAELLEVPVGSGHAATPAAAAPEPAPARVAPAPPPAPARAPTPAPAVVSAPAPAPAPAQAAPSRAAVEQGKAKPNCKLVCDRFVQAVDSDGAREPIRDLCMRRCGDDDLEFAKCAWQAKNMQDVLACGALPESR